MLPTPSAPRPPRSWDRPRRVAFKDGKPTVPAEKFAEKVGLSLDEIELRETPKGKYLFAAVEESVAPTREILGDILVSAVKAIPFPKTMRWADTDFAFARPIQTFIALFGDDLIEMEIEGIRSGRTTWGHRFHHPELVTIGSPESYEEDLRKASIIVDVEERKEAVRKTVAEVAATSGGVMIEDDELLDIVTHLVEIPYPVMGSFENDFLAVPKEVLITSMREHQKYFAVEDKDGKLLPVFIAVNNTNPKDMGLVRTGHERVLRARLSDARFFWDQDQKSTFADWNAKLEHVLFQRKLGTIAEKVGRIRGLAAFLAGKLGVEADLAADLDRAAELSKADLECKMVYEFPEVQGIMGRAYGEVFGENARVCQAIEDHYKPLGSGAELPGDLCGALLSISDKMDTLCGCFGVGLQPTGAADPFALRRATIGILQILKGFGLEIALSELIEKGVIQVEDKLEGSKDETIAAIHRFMETRLVNLLAEEGFGKDTIQAVCAANAEIVPDVVARVEALNRMKGHPDFQPLAAAFKRAGNLLKKADSVTSEVDEAKFEEAAEKALFTAVVACREVVDGYWAEGKLDQALIEVAKLRGPVDTFFEDVMVMAEDPEVKANRLGLLAMIAGIFDRFADFSKISA